MNLSTVQYGLLKLMIRSANHEIYRLRNTTDYTELHTQTAKPSRQFIRSNLNTPEADAAGVLHSVGAHLEPCTRRAILKSRIVGSEDRIVSCKTSSVKSANIDRDVEKSRRGMPSGFYHPSLRVSLLTVNLEGRPPGKAFEPKKD